MIYQGILKQLACIALFFIFSTPARSQRVLQETFYYNPAGFTYIPGLSKPSIIYQGRLYTGRKQLKALFGYVNNEALNAHFKKYLSNKTSSNIVSLAGLGLSVYSLLEWRTSERKFNWYVFGSGLVMRGVSGYLDAKANEHLRNAALAFGEAVKKTTFVPAQPGVTFTIPIN